MKLLYYLGGVTLTEDCDGQYESEINEEKLEMVTI